MPKHIEFNDTKIYRKGMPRIPERMLKLPVERGYPVPWFVAEIGGSYDFRVIDSRKFAPAIQERLCWVCGQLLGSALAFTIGPMCAVNRVISEPPSHRTCAEFSIKACPFLTQQEIKRNTVNLPEGTIDAAGCGIKRQPGCVLLWITKTYKPFRVSGDEKRGGNDGILFQIGEPTQLFWFREGRAATRAEVLESIESGLPILREMAEKDGPRAVLMLEDQIQKAYTLLPPETPKRKLFGSAAKR